MKKTRVRSQSSSGKAKTHAQLLAEVAELRNQLAETRDELSRLKTKLPEAEMQLEHERELLESLFEKLPVLLVVWEPELQSFRLNRHAEAVLGWTTEDANEGDFMAKVYPDPGYRDRVAAFMQFLESRWQEWVGTSKNGEKIPIEWANVRLRDHTMVGIGVDLRERKEAEESLRASQERFLMAAQAAKIGAYSRNLRTGKDYWSPEFLAIYGLGHEEPLPLEKGLPAAIHPEDRKELMAEAKARLRRNLSPEFNQEHRIVLPDGQIRWVVSRGTIEFDEQDQALFVHGIVMDITERKNMETQLEESERLFRTVVENSRDGIHQFDLLQRKYVFMSPSQKRLTGFSRQELEMGMEAAARRLHPDDRPNVERYMEGLLAGEEPREPMEYRWLVKSGEYRWFSDARSVIRNDQGEPVALVGSSRDITDKKRVEAELRQAKKELEARVRQRTMELQRRAEQLSELSSELTMAEQRERKRIAQILHDDLQQMLSAAKLHAEGLGEKIADRHKRDLLKIGELLTESINASRSLTMELSPPILQEKNVSAILEWIAAWAKSTHGLEVELQAEQAALVEEEEIRNLIFRSTRELLFNIVKHAGVDHATMELSSVDEEHLLIIVRDCGKGFDGDARSVEGRSRVGFGLLSIQERVKLIGGHFTVDSSPGAGTCFSMILPKSAIHSQQIKD